MDFAPELYEIITETKYMEQLGFHVPELARNVSLQVLCEPSIICMQLDFLAVRLLQIFSINSPCTVYDDVYIEYLVIFPCYRNTAFSQSQRTFSKCYFIMYFITYTFNITPLLIACRACSILRRSSSMRVLIATNQKRSEFSTWHLAVMKSIL